MILNCFLTINLRVLFCFMPTWLCTSRYEKKALDDKLTDMTWFVGAALSFLSRAPQNDNVLWFHNAPSLVTVSILFSHLPPIKSIELTKPPTLKQVPYSKGQETNKIMMCDSIEDLCASRLLKKETSLGVDERVGMTLAHHG